MYALSKFDQSDSSFNGFDDYRSQCRLGYVMASG